MTKHFEEKLQIPLYEGKGMKYVWLGDVEIKVEMDVASNTMRILANRDGVKPLLLNYLRCLKREYQKQITFITMRKVHAN